MQSPTALQGGSARPNTRPAAARPYAGRLPGKLPETSDGPAREILLVLAPGFSYLSLGCLLEPLRYAQGLMPPGRLTISVYDLEPAQPAEDARVRLAGGRSMADLQARIAALPTAEAIFFCCGFDVDKTAREPLRRLMRQSWRAGIPIYGLGAATWALAEAGLLRGGRGAVHWSSLWAFKERNIDIDPLSKLFHPDPRVTTCAGELAVLDLVIHFAGSRFGQQVADQICDRFLVSRPRGPEADQPQQSASLLRYAPPAVQEVAGKMSRSLDQPIRIEALAAGVGISQRQLERLFMRHLNASPRNFYMDLQLGLAWQLCEQTDLPLSEIAVAAGFASNAALARKFRSRYSVSPSEMRARSRTAAKAGAAS